jgi:pyruvate kinase
VAARLASGGVPLKSSNSLFLPETPGAFSPITPADSKLLQSFAEAEEAPDWIAFSLIASSEDVRTAAEQIHQRMGGLTRRSLIPGRLSAPWPCSRSSSP